MKQRMLSLLLALALLCSLLPQFALPARAEDPYSGTCGEKLTWRFDPDRGRLSIEGSGAMTSYAYGKAPWYGYREAITTVSLPEGLTSIGSWVFRGCSSLTSVTIPNSVSRIGDYAFGFCSALTSVTIPNSVSRIGNYAFYDCSALTSVTIPSSVTSIGEAAFHGCSFTSVTIPNSVTSIGNYAFYNCSALTSVTIPEGVTSIGDGAFDTCSALTSVTIPNSVTSIGDKAFGYVYYFSGYQRIEGFTIYGCSGTAAQSYADENDFPFVVLEPPVITTQPESVGVVLGDSVTFQVLASGSDLRYQWQYKKVGASSWTTWSGKTSASLTVVGSDTNNGCKYRCVVSNSAGSVTSNAATLTVVSKPTITAQPKSLSVANGKSATLRVSATGGNLKYQWQYKKAGASSWTTWSGRSSASLTVVGSDTNNGCKYRCVVSNSAGSVNSSAATLKVTDAKPTIITQPKSLSVVNGKSATLSVSASGGNLKYQWQYKKVGATSWTTWSGRSSASLTVVGSDTNNGCKYRCVVSNSAGSVNSSAATLKVTDAKPTIITQPKSLSVANGKSATLRVSATGGNLKYQWQYKKAGASSWTTWSGRSSASLTVVGSDTNNDCQYRCVVSNSAGSVTSNAATLTVGTTLKSRGLEEN